eukprot:scaffold157200_cov56-Attheya_sp.AAC.5
MVLRVGSMVGHKAIDKTRGENTCWAFRRDTGKALLGAYFLFASLTKISRISNLLPGTEDETKPLQNDHLDDVSFWLNFILDPT